MSYSNEYIDICNALKYGCCPRFKGGGNSTYTFTKSVGGGGGMYLVSATTTKLLLPSCSTQPADVHEGIPLLSKI